MRTAIRVLAHVGAFLAAVVVPTLVVTLVGGSLSLATLIFTDGIALALLLGVPLYLVLRQWKRVNVYTSALGGLIAAAVPIALLTWPLRYASLGSTESFDGVATKIGGAPTAAGWALYGAGIVRYALLGAIGGLVFFAILKLGGELARRDRITRARVVATAAVSTVAILSAIAILSIPSYTRDRTCHGEYRPALIGPRIDLEVEDSEWPALSDLLHRYADDHRLSVRDLSEVRPSVRILYLSICDSQTMVFVHEQRWSSHGSRSPMPGLGVGITVYHASEEGRWRPLALDLIDRLRARWPESVAFVDEGGRRVSAPQKSQSEAGGPGQSL